MSLPTGTITFLFTDIEGSAKLWERCPEAMRLALVRHDTLLREAVERHNGCVFKTIGDAFCAAFPTALEALDAALEAQLTLQRQEWGETGTIRVRMGLHTGEAEERDNDYFGPTLNRVARLQAIGHGQQTLLSQTACDQVFHALPAEASLQDMGMHRLKDLASPEHVWQLHHPALPRQFPPLKSLDYLPTNLPQQLTSFIGREKEMTEIEALLTKTRLLTLTGSGGTGKTRMSLQAGADLLDDYKDGVWLVEFASFSDPALVLHTVATVLHLREEPGRSLLDTITDSLKDRSLLLLLDNCEHVLNAAAQLADTLLKRCPQVKILASSREGLGVAGEQKYRVPSLALPPLAFSPEKGGQRGMTAESLIHFEAVRLFFERAALHKPDFAVTPSNAPALVSVCHRLDGIPLAIELAAARVRALPVEEINARLDHRFRLLSGGSRTALPRQQTLRALIDWSYDLLNDQEKTLLHRLSVFAGGWTLEAAEAVCSDQGVGCRVWGVGENPPDQNPANDIPGSYTSHMSEQSGNPTPHTRHPTPFESWEVLDLLTSLVDKSLVIFEAQAEAGRYRLLETVRQYAGERLRESGDEESVGRRHRDCFLLLAEEAEQHLRGPEQAFWLERLETEHDNLRSALGWSLKEKEEGEAALRLCGALCPFWEVRGYLSEGRSWCESALAKTEGQTQTRARAKAYNGAGNLARFLGDLAASRSLQEQSLAIFRELGDKRGAASALTNLGNVVRIQGDSGQARLLYKEGLAFFREIENRHGIAISLTNLGNVDADQGDYVSARALWEESLAIRRELGDRQGIAGLLNNLGLASFLQGDYASARSLYVESLTLYRESGNKGGIIYLLEVLASLAAQEGAVEQAAMLWGAEEILREDIGAPRPPNEQADHDRDISTARKALGETAFAAAWAEGRALSLEQAISLALKQNPLPELPR